MMGPVGPNPPVSPCCVCGTRVSAQVYDMSRNEMLLIRDEPYAVFSKRDAVQVHDTPRNKMLLIRDWPCVVCPRVTRGSVLLITPLQRECVCVCVCV